MRLEHRVGGHLVRSVLGALLAVLVGSAGAARAAAPVSSFDTKSLRLRVVRSGQARLRLEGSGPSFGVPPGLLTIVDATARTLIVNLDRLAKRPLHCHVTPSALRCTTGNLRWRVRPEGKASEKFELTVLRVPEADDLPPATVPLTITLVQHTVQGDVQLVSTIDSCVARPRTDVYCKS